MFVCLDVGLSAEHCLGDGVVNEGELLKGLNHEVPLISEQQS